MEGCDSRKAASGIQIDKRRIVMCRRMSAEVHADRRVVRSGSVDGFGAGGVADESGYAEAA